MDIYLGGLAAAATQEKAVLKDLVSNNAKFISQLEALTKKCDQLASVTNSSSSSGVTMLNGWKLKLVQHKKNGYCHTHGYKYTKGYSSQTCAKPGPNHDRTATLSDAKGGSAKNSDWVCSHYEEIPGGGNN